MRIYKTRQFNKWAVKQKLPDSALIAAVDEIDKGLVEASLGAQVYKKRVRLTGRGKRGGARTIVAHCAGSKAFFIYGYAKKEKADISETELIALKKLATKLLKLKDADLALALKHGELQEIKNDQSYIEGSP